MESFKMLFGTLFNLVKKAVGFIKGDGIEDLAKRLPALLGGLLLAFLALRSSGGLHRSESAAKPVKAGRKQKTTVKKHGKKALSVKRGPKGKKKKGASGLIKRLLLKLLFG